MKQASSEKFYDFVLEESRDDSSPMDCLIICEEVFGMSKVSFLGAGSWGTALAVMLAKNGHEVTIWSAISSEIDMLEENREHKHRLPGVKLPSSIRLTRDLEKACTGFELIVFSVASPFVRETAKKACGQIAPGQCIVNVAKVIENDTL